MEVKKLQLLLCTEGTYNIDAKLTQSATGLAPYWMLTLQRQQY